MTHVTHRTYCTHWIHGPLAGPEDVNVVFFRGMSLDALTRGLLSVRRIPLAYAKGGEGEWGLVMHDMFGWDDGDYDRPDYRRLCRDGGELAVFTTEPCVGDQPDLPAPALTAARLIGPHAEYDRDDREERTVRAISGFFSLPDPDFSLT